MKTVRIRKNQFAPMFMQKDGTWGDWKTAKKFTCQDAAIRFADKHGASDCGLF